MNKLPNIHPGEILREEFLGPMGITAYRLAKETGIPQTRISQILKGKRGISADTSIRFAKFFGLSEQYWIKLQNLYDVEAEKRVKEKEYNKIKKNELEIA